MEIIEARVKNLMYTEAEWLAANPIVLKGEVAFVVFGNFVNTKMGDGIKTFSQLTYNLQVPAAFRGTAMKALDPGIPTGPEFYFAGESGVFPKFSNLTVDLTAGITILVGSAGVYTKVVIPIVLAAYQTIADSNFAGYFATTALANQAIKNEIGANGKNNRDGKTVNVGPAGNYVLYGWKGGTADSNLIEFNIKEVISDVTEALGYDLPGATTIPQDLTKCFVNRFACTIDGAYGYLLNINVDIVGTVFLVQFSKAGTVWTEKAKYVIPVAAGYQTIDLAPFNSITAVGDTFGIAYNGSSRIKYTGSYSADTDYVSSPLNASSKYQFTDVAFPANPTVKNTAAIAYRVITRKIVTVKDKVNELSATIPSLQQTAATNTANISANTTNTALVKASVFDAADVVSVIQNAIFDDSATWKGTGFSGWAFGIQLPATTKNINGARGRYSRVLQNSNINFKLYKRAISAIDSISWPGLDATDVLLNTQDRAVSSLEQTDEFQYINFPLNIAYESSFIYLAVVLPTKADGSRGDMGSDSHSNTSASALRQFQRGYFINASNGSNSIVLASNNRQVSGEFNVTMSSNIDRVAKNSTDIELIKTDVEALKIGLINSVDAYDRITGDATVNGLIVNLNLAFNRAGVKTAIPTVVTLEATTKISGAVTNGITMPYQSQTKAVYGIALKVSGYRVHTVSNLVLRNAADSSILVLNTDYRFFPSEGVISGAKSSVATLNVNATFDYVRERIDLIQYNPITGAVSVVKGVERNSDASETPYRPVKIDYGIDLYYAVIRGTDVTLVNVFDWVNTFKISKESELSRLISYGKGQLIKTMRKLLRGEAFTISSFGDSIAAIQSATNGFAPNGVNRDRIEYMENAAPDFLATIPLYDHGDGGGPIHVHISYFWYLINFLKNKYGSAISYNNYGIAGTSSGSTATNGLDPNRIQPLIADASTLVILNFGMNEIGSLATYANIKSIIQQGQAVGKEFIVMGCPRPNSTGGHSTVAQLRITNNSLKQAAMDTGSAFVPVQYFVEDDRLGFMGVDGRYLCNTNIYNHPSIWELQKYGEMLTMLF